MEFDPGERDTICLSESKGIGNIASIENIVPFTHWLGSLYAALRHAAQSGQYPNELLYGPPGREKVRPVGPLVEYRIENSRVCEAEFAWTDLPRPARAEFAEPAIARSSLPPIWLNIDPVQDRNFRWPFHGIYILTGGPGTGKTSVALLRIRFLIEQQLQRDMIALLPTGVAPLEKEFFAERDMLVVVWEQHLQPYLKDSLLESRFGDVPVQHYDDWLNERLRSYVPIGVYRIEEGQTALEAVKRRFTETQLGEWIDSWERSGKESMHTVAANAYEMILALVDKVRKGHRLVAGPERALENWEVLPMPLDRTRFRYTEAGVDAAIRRAKSEIETLAKKCAEPEPVVRTGPASARPVESPSERLRRREELQAAIPAVQRGLDELRSELQAALPNRYPELLLAFYEWETERWVTNRGRFSEPARNDFVKGTREKLQAKRRLSKTDRVLILWLIPCKAGLLSRKSLHSASLAIALEPEGL